MAEVFSLFNIRLNHEVYNLTVLELLHVTLLAQPTSSFPNTRLILISRDWLPKSPVLFLSCSAASPLLSDTDVLPIWMLAAILEKWMETNHLTMFNVASKWGKSSFHSTPKLLYEVWFSKTLDYGRGDGEDAHTSGFLDLCFTSNLNTHTNQKTRFKHIIHTK